MLILARAICFATLSAIPFGFEARSQEAPPQAPQVQSEQQTNGATESQQQGTQQTTPTQQAPAIEQHNPAEDAKRQTDHDAEKRAEEAREYWPFHILGARLKITDSLLALFTFILIVVGIGQGIFLFRTDRGTHKAANAAKQSADIAERSLVELQRALMIISKFTINQLGRGKSIIGYRITAEFVNAGNTAAKRFSGTANIVVFDGGLPDDFKFPDRIEAGPPRG